MPVGAQKTVVINDIDKSAVEKAELTNILIADGAVSYSGLSEIGKDMDWLFRRLKIDTKQDLKNIILATYDEKTDKFAVHRKNDL